MLRYKAHELTELLVEMGEFRDPEMSWDKINAAEAFDAMVNNWGNYNEMIKTDEERMAEAMAGDL